jgi:hypothetical protein
MSQNDLNCKRIMEEKLKRPFLSASGKNGLKLESIIANYSDETLCSILLSKRENFDLWEEAKFNVKEYQYREERLGEDAASFKKIIGKITALFSQAYMLLWTAEILAPATSPDPSLDDSNSNLHSNPSCPSEIEHSEQRNLELEAFTVHIKETHKHSSLIDLLQALHDDKEPCQLVLLSTYCNSSILHSILKNKQKEFPTETYE